MAAILMRYRQLGIQQRIMLYVAAGLAVMFGSFAALGWQSVQQATELVYQERLSTVYTIVGILQRDFSHVARDVQEETSGTQADDAPHPDRVARRLLDHLALTDPFRFFQVTGVWILDPQGQLSASAGNPPRGSDEELASVVSAAAGLPENGFTVLPARRQAGDSVPFVTVVTRVAGIAGASGHIVAIHTVSNDSTSPYDPTADGRGAGAISSAQMQPANSQLRYDLEVVGPDGLTVLGLGVDEHPGMPSVHFPKVRGIMASGESATFLHEPTRAETFAPHVMAIAPLGASGFYVLLEQPADVALALPNQVRQRLLLLTTVGFLATLLVAWVTTRHIVKPAQQLTEAARRMARGDLGIPITISAQDEVGKLAESLETMRQQLRAAYERLEDTNKGLEVQVKERTDRLAELLREIISAQEDERSRLARELHDETAQTLGALLIALDRARDGLPQANPRALEQIAAARMVTARLLEETRRLILDLRPMALDDLGLAPAIRSYAETHLEDQGVEATVEVEQPSMRLPKYVEVSLFRIVQEAVNNIAKHAGAHRAIIRLVFRNSVASIVVTDDGKGFDVSKVLDPTVGVQSIGLLGMQERVRLLNGHLDIRSQMGTGTAVSIEIPIEEGAGVHG